jgi:hypothetical protein
MQARNNQDALTQLVAVQQAVPKLCGMVSSSSSEAVCLGGVLLLGALAAANSDARTQAVASGCVPQLLVHMASPTPELATAAAGALMMLTLAKEGKVAVHQVRGAVCTRACRCMLQGMNRQADRLLCATPLRAQAGGLAVCLGVLAVQLQRLQDGGQAAGAADTGSASSGLLEALAVNTLQAITNAAEYPPCNTELARAPQLQVRARSPAPAAALQLPPQLCTVAASIQHCNAAAVDAEGGLRVGGHTSILLQVVAALAQQAAHMPLVLAAATQALRMARVKGQGPVATPATASASASTNP